MGPSDAVISALADTCGSSVQSSFRVVELPAYVILNANELWSWMLHR